MNLIFSIGNLGRKVKEKSGLISLKIFS